MNTTATETMNSPNLRSKKPADSAAPDCDVVIVGSGPYGLSAAAHLKAKGLAIRIFGEPMEFWANNMPQGMLLRSPREASTISDPRSDFTLEAYETATGTKPATRVAREVFVNYGTWFQAQLGTDLDRRNVSEVRREGSVFTITLSDGTTLKSRRVVVATGVGKFQKTPKQFQDLSGPRVSHCYDGRQFGDLGKRVAVIGAGQSALESAALLHEAGLNVEVIARISVLRWIGMHKRLHQLGIISKVLYSKHDIGPIGISRLVAYPKLMYHVPLGVKDPIRTRAVRSAGAPWLIPRLSGVPIATGRSVLSAKEIGDEVELKLDDGSERRVDHILLGTGYRVDIAKYEFLSPELLKEIRQLDGYPEVGPGFSTSVPGLHFIGAAGARNFGPLLYFVTGTDFASRELTSYISKHRL
jgi:FAD-dependent urate hydroxylase